MRIAFFTAICEGDAEWIDQYLKEIDRLGFDFAIHLDRCSEETMKRLISHPKCIGFTTNKKGKEFSERDKQGVLDILIREKYEMAINADIDETWEKDAPRKFEEIYNMEFDVVDYRWLNVWDKPNQIRYDGPFGGGHRTKIYNLRSKFDWIFHADTVNGAAAHLHGTRVYEDAKTVKYDLVSLHWGLFLKRHRDEHKERWDRIYGKYTGGKNPYGLWEYACDEKITPQFIENIWL